MRGLVEKSTDPKDNRRFIYKPSFDLLSFMGVKSVEELPDYAEVADSIKTAIKTMEEESREANAGENSENQI